MSTTVKPLDIRVASGERITCDHLYKQVSIRIQGIHIIIDLYALPLGELDAVFKVQ